MHSNRLGSTSSPAARPTRASDVSQFMPFAALTGYEDVLNRTVRVNEEAIAKANTPVDVAEGYMPA